MPTNRPLSIWELHRAAHLAGTGQVDKPLLVRGYAMFSGFTDNDGAKLYHHAAVWPNGRVAMTDEWFRLSFAWFDEPGRDMGWRWVQPAHVDLDEIEAEIAKGRVHYLGEYQPPKVTRG